MHVPSIRARTDRQKRAKFRVLALCLGRRLQLPLQRAETSVARLRGGVAELSPAPIDEWLQLRAQRMDPDSTGVLVAARRSSSSLRMLASSLAQTRRAPQGCARAMRRARAEPR